MRLSNILLLGSIVLFLSACATKPVIKTEIQTVKVPVSVPCKVVVPPKPEYGFDSLRTSDTLYTKVQVLLSDRLLSKGYEQQLTAALNTCTK